MKPVYQSDTSESGDCFSACIASLLELPLAKVPHFRKISPDWMILEAARWLQSRFDIHLVSSYDVTIVTPLICIAAVASRKHAPPGNHSIIVEAKNGQLKILHDPNQEAPYPVGELLDWKDLRRLYILVGAPILNSTERRYCINCLSRFEAEKPHQKVCRRECGLEYIECVRQQKQSELPLSGFLVQ